MKVTMRILATTALALAATPGVLLAQYKLDEKRSAAPDGLVEIDNGAGTIRVIGWNKPEVTVTGSLGPGAEGLGFSGGPRRTQIDVETRGNPHGIKSDLEIHVPLGSRVEISSFAADINVSDVTGSVSAEGVNSSITIAGSTKEVSAQTVNGSVEITGPSTRIHAESVNGAVSVRGASGEVEASTVNGRLDVTGGSFERASLETVSGSLRFEGNLAKEALFDASTVSGSVEIVLPASVTAEFSLTTFSGEIQNELGTTIAKRTSKYTSEKQLEFTTGEGGANISVQTLSGSILIRKR